MGEKDSNLRYFWNQSLDFDKYYRQDLARLVCSSQKRRTRLQQWNVRIMCLGWWRPPSVPFWFVLKKIHSQAGLSGMMTLLVWMEKMMNNKMTMAMMKNMMMKMSMTRWEEDAANPAAGSNFEGRVGAENLPKHSKDGKHGPLQVHSSDHNDEDICKIQDITLQWQLSSKVCQGTRWQAWLAGPPPPPTWAPPQRYHPKNKDHHKERLVHLP